MKLLSTTDERFLKTIEAWLAEQPEILVQMEFSRTAGNKEFRFFSSFAGLWKELRRQNPQTRVTAFRLRQLPLRGRVDDEFIDLCLSHIPNGREFLITETIPTTYGKYSSFSQEAGETSEELRESLEKSRGKPVAVGEYPDWQEDNSDVIRAYVPDADGVARAGCY